MPALPQQAVERVLPAHRFAQPGRQRRFGQRLPLDLPVPLLGGVARPCDCRHRQIGRDRGNHPVAIGVVADKPELAERTVEQPVLVVVGHHHQARPGDFQPAREQPMGDEIARLRAQMHRERIGAEPLGQMVHHPIVVERQLQAERLAQ